MDAILYLFVAVLAIANVKLFSQLGLSIIYNLKRSQRVPSVFPKISIIVPAYNEEKTIADCIKSLLKLDYPDFEVILVDDGSTDGTLQKAKEIVDPHLRVLH
jgi:cellulose synthase/poly-beta-1,6-N-acetylglucosamine synthase-like glycosyltransferase